MGPHNQVTEMPMMMSSNNNNCPYNNLKMSPADNGCKVTYYEAVPGRNPSDHMNEERKEFVFGEKDFKQAVAKYKEVSDCIASYNKK